jgi:hypothetical protein
MQTHGADSNTGVWHEADRVDSTTDAHPEACAPYVHTTALLCLQHMQLSLAGPVIRRHADRRVCPCTACTAAGKKYKNDPTILAWNLINEPRCETWVPANSWCPATLAAWFKVRASGHAYFAAFGLAQGALGVCAPCIVEPVSRAATGSLCCTEQLIAGLACWPC